MKRRIVRQLRRGTDPDMDAAVVDPLAEIAAELDRAKLDRTVGFVIAADEIRHLAEHRLFWHFFGGGVFPRPHTRPPFPVDGSPLLPHMQRPPPQENRGAVPGSRSP